MLSNELLSQISDALVKSETNRIPIDPITTTYPAVEISDAYQIQMMVVAKKARAGARSIGKKIGLTSEAMRAQLGVGEPDFGTLTDRMVHFDGDDIRIEQLIQPRVEAEVAFLLGKELRGPGVTPLSVMRSTEAVFPALEIIDSRIKDWAIKLQDTVADNASSGRVVFSEGLRDPKIVDLRGLRMKLWTNGEFAGDALASAVMGHPARAVAWLANKLGEFGEVLKAGDVAMSGAISGSVKVKKGDFILAEFGSFGEIATKFV